MKLLDRLGKLVEDLKVVYGQEDSRQIADIRQAMGVKAPSEASPDSVKPLFRHSSDVRAYLRVLDSLSAALKQDMVGAVMSETYTKTVEANIRTILLQVHELAAYWREYLSKLYAKLPYSTPEQVLAAHKAHPDPTLLMLYPMTNVQREIYTRARFDACAPPLPAPDGYLEATMSLRLSMRPPRDPNADHYVIHESSGADYEFVNYSNAKSVTPETMRYNVWRVPNSKPSIRKVIAGKSMPAKRLGCDLPVFYGDLQATASGITPYGVPSHFATRSGRIISSKLKTFGEIEPAAYKSNEELHAQIVGRVGTSVDKLDVIYDIMMGIIDEYVERHNMSKLVRAEIIASVAGDLSYKIEKVKRETMKLRDAMGPHEALLQAIKQTFNSRDNVLQMMEIKRQLYT
jgi:hypothetical protein